MKLSLHIALNRVNPAAYGGWKGVLAGCHNDADAMLAIANSRGAQSYMLLDEEATLRRVVDAFHLLSLHSNPGDTVMITYSGHGGQVYDRNQDESDGFDETWCLYDAQLIDDDITRMLAAFKKGVQVIVVSDSCHSGTVTKASFQAEQASMIGGRRIKSAPSAACRIAKNSGSILGTAEAKIPRQKATILLLGGCQDNQFSYDGEVNGLFTSKLLHVWGAGQFTGNYREFRKAIVKLMPPEQTPSIHIMGGKDKAFESGPVFQ